MALADTARLIASLELDTSKFQRGAAQAGATLGRMEGTFSRVATRARAGLATATANIAKIGVVAAGGIGIAVHQGLEALATLESATTAADGAIRQMGLTGKVTAAEIAQWANEIEAASDAAFDDKDIISATASLIRFGGITKSNIRPAMEIITDLAVKTGNVGSAANLLGRALVDPAQAAGRLARAGVVLDKETQKQIISFVKAGKTAKAQALILDSVAKVTKNAAKDSVGQYGDSLNILNDTVEDATRALATGFLPIITKVRDILSTELAKPSTIAAIKDFGGTLASGLGSLVDIVRNLPWGTIGQSLRIAGEGAKTVLNAFSSLPDWVQTAVITGWGLNKLTGGALGDIVGTLASGLVKGVLGITAGVVNLKAATVVGGGAGLGVPGATAAPAAGASRLSRIGSIASKVFIVGEAIGLAVGINALREEIGAASTAQATALKETALAPHPGKSTQDLATAIAGVDEGIDRLSRGGLFLVAGDSLNQLKEIKAALVTEKQHVDTANASDFRSSEKQLDNVFQEQQGTTEAIASGLSQSGAVAAGQRDTKLATVTGFSNTTSAVLSGTSGTTGAVNSGTNRIVGALGNLPPPVVDVDITNNVSAADIETSVTSRTRSGSGSSSRKGGGGGSNQGRNRIN